MNKKLNLRRSYEFYIRFIGHAMRYTNDEKLQEMGITHQQAKLLGSINRSLDSGEKITRKALEEKMYLRGSSVTSLLNSLEKNGFIDRTPGKTDRRSIVIEITPQGQEVIDTIRSVFRQTEKQMLQGMTDIEKQVFLNLLEKVYFNLSGEKDEK